MIAVRRTLAIAAAVLLTTPMAATACSTTPRKGSHYLKEWAANGYLVRARVVRGFDAVKRLPEQLEIEKVFMGDDLPRFVTLYRDKEFFDQHAPLPPGTFRIFDDCSIYYEGAESASRLLMLFPARSETGAEIPGAFRLYMGSSVPDPGRKLDLMLNQAKRHGRLRERPQPSDFPPDLTAN